MVPHAEKSEPFDPLDLYVVARRSIESAEDAGPHAQRIERTAHHLLEESCGSLEGILDQYVYEEDDHALRALSHIREIRAPELFCEELRDALHSEAFLVVTLALQGDERRLYYIETDHQQMGYVFLDGFDEPLLATCQGVDSVLANGLAERICTSPFILCRCLNSVLLEEGLVPAGMSLREWLGGWYTTRPVAARDVYWIEQVIEMASERPDLFPPDMAPIRTTHFIVESDATHPGETIALVFSPDWNPYEALELDGQDYPTWRGERDLPRGLDLEFKVIVSRSERWGDTRGLSCVFRSSWVGGEHVTERHYIDWEIGPNRSLSRHREQDTIRVTSPEFSLG